jgi:O-glycosyl hydrolase/regulation of enolase protein 1 (concanavalin A-like superfamily)
MAMFGRRASRRHTGFRRRLFIEPLEDRRLLAVVTLDPSTIFQTVQGFGTAAVYPTDLVTIEQAGAIMSDAGMTVVRVTPSAYDYTYTVGGSMTTPVPISANLDENVARFYPDDNNQVDLLQWLVANSSDPDDVKMIGALWSPPHWMKITTGRLMNWDDNGTPRSEYDPIIPWGDYGQNTGAGRVDPDMWTDWSRYVLSTIKSWEQKTGLSMYAFSFQNEPNVPAVYNSCTFAYIANDVNNPSAGFTDGHWELYGDGLQALVDELALHPEITTMFFGPELSQLGGGASNPYNLGNYNAVRQDLISRGLLDDLGGWATHEYTYPADSAAMWDAWYNGSAHTALILSNGSSDWLSYLGPTPGIAGDNKEIWQTESEGENQTWTKDGAMGFGLKIQNALVYGNVSGYTSWTLTGYSSTDTWGLVDLDDIDNPTNSYKYDAMMQFSRYISPGAERINAVFENGKVSIGGANELDSYNGLTVSAFNHAEDERLTMVFTNMKTSSESTTITIPAGVDIASFQVFVTSGTQKFAQLADLIPSGGQITLTIPASSFVTITGTYESNPAAPTVATPAAATPSTVTGTTTNLTVLGYDQAGESNLTYTWSTTGTPPAAVVFSVNDSSNGTNAAKNATATFSKAGTYNFTVTITNAFGSVYSNVNVTVDQTLTGTDATISPASTIVAPGSSVQFNVYGMDQFGDTMATPLNDVTWSVYSGVGTIDSSGLYSAPIGGTGVTTVRAVTSTGQILYANAELVITNIFTGNQDVGSFTPAGSYSENSGVYTVNGAGSDIQGTSDQFQFAYLVLNGNGTITARVDSVENTNAWAKAGVMFRNTLAANSANAFLAMTPGNGATFQYRSSAGGNTSWMNTSGLSAPYWVRLTRSGNNFTAYRSSNGVDWTQIGSTTAITMNSTVYVGLAVTSHSSGNLCTSIFSNVSVTTPDTTAPTVAINQAGSQTDPANSSPVNFTVVFSEIVTDFATGDVTLSGTAGATTATVTGSGATYNVAVSGMTANGTVIASLLAGVAHDAANNPSLASTSTDNTVTFSSLLPIADIGDTYTVSEGSSVTLDASNSYDPDGWIVSYLWDLDNDGQYDDASGVTANFSRTDDGSYTVGVKVIDNFGGEDTDTATVTVTPLPDYNGNGVVDGADYTVWRDTLGQSGLTPYSGADGDGDGMVDSDDFLVWKANFGATVPSPGSGSGAISAAAERAFSPWTAQIVEPVAPLHTESTIESAETNGAAARADSFAMLERQSGRHDLNARLRGRTSRHSLAESHNNDLLLLALNRVAASAHHNTPAEADRERIDPRAEQRYKQSFLDELLAVTLAEW